MGKTYRDAGVDIEKGDRFVEFIKSLRTKAVSSEIGGFSGGFEIDTKKYRHPVILTTTDGVGTKLMIAQKLGVYDTVGIDLVAMCVNDLITGGAQPVSFLDYIACGRINESVLRDIVRGIVEGCEQADCTLSGGETAEMPDMYGTDDLDLAGFAVGIVEKESLLPALDKIAEGTPLYGLKSSGIHSNGFSLARKALPLDNEKIMRELLVPTKIYVKDFFALAKGGVAGAAHITGGGLEANIQRILPAGMEPALDFAWEVPWIFREIQKQGDVSDQEMRRVFNLGIGMALAVCSEYTARFEEAARSAGIEVVKIGSVIRGKTT
ncbi:MAG: phosphoribosylformylglycinamidine cyclo-ligase [Spirochaetales bacterium]|nr:phosphoribosylformylglycinamidine cyclo-ligase [Spirochaetales bacterium]